MQFQENFDLASVTTFHIGGPAKFFCACESVEELTEAVEFARAQNLPVLILGGGSNVLISDQGYNGLVINFRLKGLTILEENSEQAVIKVGAGEVWDEVVKFAVDHNLWGIENLSHIPGLSGGAVVQNVGAYGQEAADVLVSVEVLDLQDLQTKTIRRTECQFGYRSSIFNTQAKGRCAILSLTLNLSKQPNPKLSYGDVTKYFTAKGVNEPTQAEIRQAITEIRDRKFPFPTQPVNGNAGSFFRGPILRPQEIEYFYQKLATNFGKEALERFTKMSDYLMVAQGMKTPAGFLIEICGQRGRQMGGAKVHTEHGAIVINATGKATASDVTQLFTAVGREVHQKTGAMLHIEPELIGYTEEEKEQILDSVI